jgi:hypothetical protein
LTKRRLSRKLLFPEPLAPTRAVNGSRSTTAWPMLLKLWIWIWRSLGIIGFGLAPDAVSLAARTSGVQAGARRFTWEPHEERKEREGEKRGNDAG